MYKSLDMPVDLFHKIIETDNLQYLLAKPKHAHAKRIRSISKGYRQRTLSRAWEKINDQFITEFGVTEEFKSIFYKQQDINKQEILSLLGDTSADFLIREYKEQLAYIKSKIQPVTNYKKHHAELHRAIQVAWPGRNTHDLTVFEFYNDVNDLMKESEQKELRLIRTGTDG